MIVDVFVKTVQPGFRKVPASGINVLCLSLGDLVGRPIGGVDDAREGAVGVAVGYADVIGGVSEGVFVETGRRAGRIRENQRGARLELDRVGAQRLAVGDGDGRVRADDCVGERSGEREPAYECKDST